METIQSREENEDNAGDKATENAAAALSCILVIALSGEERQGQRLAGSSGDKNDGRRGAGEQRDAVNAQGAFITVSVDKFVSKPLLACPDHCRPWAGWSSAVFLANCSVSCSRKY